MPTISIRFYYQEDVDKWLRAEQRGRIGPRQKALLNHWRALKQQYPDLKRFEVWTGMELAVPSEPLAQLEAEVNV